MPQLLAFLSYTRKDDDFSRGYITAFRKMLENAVHVVTGEDRLQIFQDIEGIVIGENWQKKLDDVIQKSSFLLPMVSPYFLNSKPCRDEVAQFLKHERALNRHDLILPIYYFESAKIEKREQSDALVKELVERQMFDWREKAYLPLIEPPARKALVELAGQIAKAIERLEVPEREAKLEGNYEALAADPRVSAGVAGNPKREKVASRTVLWVDDNPDNNIWERRALKAYGVRFLLARDTSWAQKVLIERGQVAAIISDMGRVGDPEAGFTLLERVRRAGIQTPYFIYTSPGLAAKLELNARMRGAQGITADPDALVEMVVAGTR